MDEPWWPLKWTDLPPKPPAAMAVVYGHPCVTEVMRSFDGSVTLYGNLPMTKDGSGRMTVESVLDLRCLLLSLASPDLDHAPRREDWTEHLSRHSSPGSYARRPSRRPS